MSIIRDILSWAQGLPAWQGDAIRRLFVMQTLSTEDLEDLFALLKTEHGIPDPKNRIAKKIDSVQTPSVTQPNAPNVLLAMKNLRHVNAIAENHRLSFSPQGLTVIYGDNGSGKSGYSRVLKRACRARDQTEAIHPNAHLPAGQAGIAEAVFELNINGITKNITWNNSKPPPEELSSLAIFDARCARAYLDEEDDFAYVPYGLDILEELARVCKHIDSLIRNELAQNTIDKTVFDFIRSQTTRVGALINSLSANTKSSEVEDLAILSEIELSRRDELERSLKADNPKEKATQLRLRSTRIGRIAKIATEKLALVDKAVETKLRVLVDAHLTTKAAAELATQTFKEDATLLPGTGGEAWKKLFEAARTFCMEALPDKTFPHLGTDAQCPFCQQPLNEGADRLLRFEKFIQNESEKKAQACKKAFSDEYKVFTEKTLVLGLDEELFAEIGVLDKALAAATRDFEKALVNRQNTIKTACTSNEWDKIAPEPTSPAAPLQALANRLTQEADNLDKASDEKARSAMQAEFNELDARLKLAKMKPTVLAVIEKLILQDKLNKCLGAVKTNAISLKSKELSEKVISRELADALNKEFKELGAGNLQVSLQSHSEKGKTLHKLKLELPQVKNLGDILSEGEQRAIAIGSFLAEVNIGGGTGGIIFDDPVSSLDHERRERVARRLVHEAIKRQVIIFTHDLYFLCILMDEAKQSGVNCLPQSLWQKQKEFGIPDFNIPFGGMETKARIGALRNNQQEITKLYRNGDKTKYQEETINAYRQLRNTWERAVEEVLFRNVVLRFRKGVSTQRLAGVVVEHTDYATIDQGMTKCSNFSHDNAILSGVTAIPDPDELLADINTLDKWRLQVEQRTTEIINKRKIS